MSDSPQDSDRPEAGSARPGDPPAASPGKRSDPSETGRPAGSAARSRQRHARRLEQSTFWGWMRQTARLWGFLAFLVLILIVFRGVVMPFVLGVLVAYLLAPVLRRLCQVQLKGFRLPRVLWLMLVYAALLGLMVLFVTSFVPRVSNDFKRIVLEAPAFWEKAEEQWIPQLAAWVQLNFGEPPEQALRDRQPPAPPLAPTLRFSQLPSGELEVSAGSFQLEVVDQGKGSWLIRAPQQAEADPPGEQRVADAIIGYLKDIVQSSERQLNQVLQLGQAFVIGLLKAITTFILVFMISAFLLADPNKILGTLRSLVPSRYYNDFDNVVFLIDKGLSGAIRGQLLICVNNGILTWIGLMLIGVKYPLLLAVLAAVMSLIPIFGSILSSIPIVIVALVSGSQGLELVKGLLILAWIIGIHLLEANLLNPKIIGSAARIHPVVVIFAVVAGEHTYGAIGALLGVPLVSAVQAIFVYLRERVRGEVGPGPGAGPAGASA